MRMRAFVIALIASAFYLLPLHRASGENTALPSSRVVRVHDGDTVSISIGTRREKARLLGIDAPELDQRPWGERAKRHLEKILDSTGRVVTVEGDIGERDQFGRLLVYLWTKDQRLINAEMVRDGYAVLYTSAPNVKYGELLQEAQHAARDHGRGIWGKEGLKQLPRQYRKEHPRY